MQSKNKILYIRAVIILIGAVLALLAFTISHLDDDKTDAERPITSVAIGESEFDVLIADTNALRQKGLSGRPVLKEDEGMLFIFDDADIRGFWMKDMLFPLDIIWIDEAQKIVNITKNARPESYPESFSSNIPVQYALEINAGLAEIQDIIIGETVEFIRK